MGRPGRLGWENKLEQFPQFIILILIFLFTFVIHVFSPVTTSTDSAWTLHLAASILREGNIDLDEYRNVIDLKLDYRLRVFHNHIYSYYPIATPLLVTPIVWIINEAYPLFYPTDFYSYLARHTPDAHTAKIEKLIASGIVALATLLTYLIARRYLGIINSLFLAFIFAFSTSMWSTASRALWQHGPSVLFLSLALYLLILAKEKAILIPWVGLILGFAYLIRPTNSLEVAFFGLYVLVNFRKYILLYILGVAAVLIPYIILNWFTYRNIFPPYSYQLFERLSTVRVFGEALAGTLISPARGLFIFSSVFIFSIFGAILKAKQKQISFASVDLYIIGILLSHWLITCLFEDWGGAWSIGPRYFVDVIPFLVFFLIPVFQFGLLVVPAWKYAFVITVLLSTFIQFHCSTSIYPFMWNQKPQALVDAPERKWDWSDLQFLRGFCPNNPLEGKAPACWFIKND
jgi:hypothetical protein